jgi:DNA polymerase III delta' subunit
MEHVVTRGQPRALAAVRSMVLGPAPHAVLFVGPPSSGKTTLAMDLAAGLLCLDPDPAARPCRTCRGCHQVASGNHPDLHRLAPDGPGGQVRIGKATDPEPGTVRHLIGELALLPVEGGARVALVEQAHRLNEDAQNALLKMLEEPPQGVTIVLCADDEDCLLPTVRSRCTRVRLGPVAGREIERWLGELGAADAPQAARLARLSEGSPGLALAYARSPDAGRLRGEIARGLLDMFTAGPQVRLAAIRSLVGSAAALDAALEAGRRGGATASDTSPAAPRRRGARASVQTGPVAGPAAGAPEAEDTAGTGRVSASDRRSAAVTLVAIWASVARDVAIAGLGAGSQVGDPELIDEFRAAAQRLPVEALPSFLARLAEAGAQLDENVNPELELDVLALAWPKGGGGAAGAARPQAAGAASRHAAGSASPGPLGPRQ